MLSAVAMVKAGASDLRACRTPLWIAGTASLAVTLVRLAGERARWAEWLFGRAAGGGGGVIGIGWLIPACGLWFAAVLARQGRGPASRWRALRTFGLGLAGVALALGLGRFVLPVTFGTFAFVSMASTACAVTSFYAWPALARVLLVYAIVARLPILVITVVAVANSWGTHYERLAPGSPPMSDSARIVVLCGAQLGIWVPLTLLVGGFTGALGYRTRQAS